MTTRPLAEESRRGWAKGASARPEAGGTVISVQQMSKFSALLWGIGCVSGELLILLPHGRDFSAGVAEAQSGSTVDDLLRLADDACDHAKQTGRGNVVVAEGALDSVVV